MFRRDPISSNLFLNMRTRTRQKRLEANVERQYGGEKMAGQALPESQTLVIGSLLSLLREVNGKMNTLYL